MFPLRPPKIFLHESRILGLVRIPSSTTDLGQSELDTPHLTLVAQAVLADNLQFRVTIPTKLETRTHDITRSTLLISGRRVLTDEPTRKLRQVSLLFRSSNFSESSQFQQRQLTTTGDLVGLGVDATVMKMVIRSLRQQRIRLYTHGTGAMAANWALSRGCRTH